MERPIRQHLVGPAHYRLDPMMTVFWPMTLCDDRDFANERSSAELVPFRCGNTHSHCEVVVGRIEQCGNGEGIQFEPAIHSKIRRSIPSGLLIRLRSLPAFVLC